MVASILVLALHSLSLKRRVRNSLIHRNLLPWVCFSHPYPSCILYTAGYYVIPGKPHDFMDTSPGSQFMNPNVLWGLHDNFNWLAEVSRVSVIPSPTNTPTQSPSTSPTSKPTDAPTTSPVLPGICSDDNNNDCSTTQDCECGQTPQRHFRELQAVCGNLKKKDCVRT